jgi:hypothetical protein
MRWTRPRSRDRPGRVSARGHVGPGRKLRGNEGGSNTLRRYVRRNVWNPPGDSERRSTGGRRDQTSDSGGRPARPGRRRGGSLPQPSPQWRGCDTPNGSATASCGPSRWQQRDLGRRRGRHRRPGGAFPANRGLIASGPSHRPSSCCAAARRSTACSVHGPAVITTACSIPSRPRAAHLSANSPGDSPGLSRVLMVFSISW